MGREYYEPYKQLMAEVIKLAVKDILKSSKDVDDTVLNKRKVDAMKWIDDEAEIINVFSFISCCWIVGVNPQTVRSEIKERTKAWKNRMENTE